MSKQDFFPEPRSDRTDTEYPFYNRMPSEAFTLEFTLKHLDRIAALEAKVAEFERIAAKVLEGMESAKQNPLLRTMMKGMGL